MPLLSQWPTTRIYTITLVPPLLDVVGGNCSHCLRPAQNLHDVESTAVPISPWVNPSSGVESGVNLHVFSLLVLVSILCPLPYTGRVANLVVRQHLKASSTRAVKRQAVQPFQSFQRVSSSSQICLHCQQSVSDTGNWRVAWPGNVV